MSKSGKTSLAIAVAFLVLFGAAATADAISFKGLVLQFGETKTGKYFLEVVKNMAEKMEEGFEKFKGDEERTIGFNPQIIADCNRNYKINVYKIYKQVMMMSANKRTVEDIKAVIYIKFRRANDARINCVKSHD